MQPEIDPVLEVAIWQEKQRIQARIQARCRKNLHTEKQMQVEKARTRAQAPTTGGAKMISLVSDSDDTNSCCSDDTMEYPAVPEAVPVAVAERVENQQSRGHKSAFPYDPLMPLTIRNLWQSIEQLPPDSLEMPQCKSKQCPYCTTPQHVPFMLQRHNLMVRLMQLERTLYGRTMHGF